MDAMERIAKLKKSLAEQERTGTLSASQSSAQISAMDRITLAEEKIKEKATSGADLSGEAWTRATPAQTKVPEKVNSGFLDRAGNTLRGTVDRQVEGYTRGLEKLTEGLGKAGSWMQDKKEEKQAEQDKQYLDKYQKDLEDALAAGDEKAAKTAQIRIKQVQKRLKANGDMGDYYDQVNAEAVRKLDAYGDQKGAESQAAFQRAKDGTGVLGGLAVDAGSALADVLGDAGANMLIPGLGTAGRVMRTFGHASEAAEEKGAGLGTQMLYGAGIAGIGEGVNRLFSGNPILEKATGKGALDDLLLPNLGKSLPGRMVKSGLGEGIEEGTEDILDALYQKAVFGEKADAFSWKETGRDALIGGIVGGLTGISKPRLTDENGNWYDANGKKNPGGDSEQTEKGTAPFKTGGRESGDPGGDVPSESSVFGKTQSVKENRSTDGVQETSMEDAAFESKAVPDHLGAVALLQKNLGEVSSMQPVAVVTGQEVPKTGVATERVMTFLKNIGGKVERPGLGDVLFSKSKVKNSLLGHGFGEAKVELMAGVPGVIRDGKQIGFTENWKGRGYDSYVFAAPVQYRGEPVYVTAIVIRDSANRYYLHEAVDQNGNMIFGQNKSPDTASDGPAAVPQDTVAGSELSENSVPQMQGRNNGKIAEQNQEEYVGNHVNISGETEMDTRSLSMGRSFDEMTEQEQNHKKEIKIKKNGFGEYVFPRERSWRVADSEGPMSKLGHAMFTDNPKEWIDVPRNLDERSDRVYSVDINKLTDINEIRDLIIKKWNDDRADDFSEYRYIMPKALSDIDGESIYEEFDPKDIVDSARAYDDEDLNAWLYERVLEPNGIYGVKTSDGAIVYDEDMIDRVASDDDIMPRLDDEHFSMGRSFSELVQNQRNGEVPTGEPDITPKLTDVQEPPAGREPTVVDLRRQAEGMGQNTVPQRPRNQNRNAMDTLGIHPVDDLADYSNTEYLRGSDEAKKVTTKARRQAEARLQPTRSEKKFAKGIANGDYTVDDIPASMSRATVSELADYYTAENSFKNTDGVQERGREIREETERMAAEMFHDEDSFRPISMLKMNERTPERVMRNIFGDRRGEQINEKYIYPVQQNEAEKVRFIQRQLDDVRTFEDSTGNRSTLTREERSIVQQIMEDRFVGETIASMEISESIRNAAENIRKGKDPLDAAREFSLNAEERGLAQQYARWTENQERLRSGEFDSVKINNAVQEFAKKYDLFYDAVNDFLTAHGYGTIGFIKGYAPHMQGADTQNKLLSALRSMGVNTDASSLPTSISGLTADYKPGKRWNPFFQQRFGEKTDYDVYQGFESYVSYLGDIFYHTDDIARLRGVSRYLRKTYGPEEITNAIDHAESLRNADLLTQTEVLKSAGKISDGTKLTYQDARKLMDEYIDELYDNVTKVSKYGEFVKYIDNYANLLAGKQSMADRGMEYMAGRTSLNAGNKLVAAFGRAQVAGNVSSVLNQSAQLSQILAEVDGKYVVKAAADLAKDTGGKLWNIKKTDLFDQSDLLTGKKGIEFLTADDSKFDRMVSAMFKPADIMDSMVSALAVQSKYNQLVAEGKPSEVAMLEADRWATQVMASRMKGSRPMAFESKNVVNQMLHMFQVEALNSWEHLSQDLPYKYRGIKETYGKKAASRAVATVITKGLVSAFLLNRVAEAAYGGTPAPFDVLGYIANFVSSGMGLTTNEALKKLVNAVWEKMFGENLLDEGQEKKPFDWGDAVADTSWNVMNDIPFVRNAAGLLGLGDQTMPFTNMAEAVKGVGKALTAEERSAGEIGGSLLELGSTILPGGRQLQKTAQGVGTMLQGGRTYGYGDKKRLQYPVKQTPGNWAQAVLFGNSGLDETREFYASGDSGLTAKQTRTVESMAAEGSDGTKIYDAIQNLRRKDQETGEAPDTAEKVARLTKENLTDTEKLRLYEETIATSESKRPEEFRQLMEEGMSWEQVAGAYIMYLELNGSDGMSATEKATRFASWADSQGLTSDQRASVKDKMAFYSQARAEASRYTAMTEAGLDSGKAENLTMRISQLRPEAGKETVSNLQRYEAVISDKGLSESEQLSALESMMEDTEFEKLEAAYAAGVTPGQYVKFKRATEGLVADKVNGKTVPGSKKEKVMAAINGMQITNSQKTALYYAAGYKESTLDDAPWYGMPDTVQTGRAWDDIMPRLSGEVEMPRMSEQDRIDDIMPKLVK